MVQEKTIYDEGQGFVSLCFLWGLVEIKGSVLNILGFEVGI